MIQWLNERGIVQDVKSTKIVLYQLIKFHKPIQNVYSIDRILAQHGHTVCRLPPYHPELNPIEKIWGICKNWVGSKNVDFTIKSVEALLRQKISDVGPNVWAEVCRHVKEIETSYIEKEHIMDELHD